MLCFIFSGLAHHVSRNKNNQLLFFLNIDNLHTRAHSLGALNLLAVKLHKNFRGEEHSKEPL